MISASTAYRPIIIFIPRERHGQYKWKFEITFAEHCILDMKLCPSTEEHLRMLSRILRVDNLHLVLVDATNSS